MPDGAHISSFETIESLRVLLLLYLSKARPLLDDSLDEVTRTRAWLLGQLPVWQAQLHRRSRVLADAQQALFSAELSKLREPSTAERTAIHKAKRAVEEAEEKLKKIKYWIRNFDSEAGPSARELDSLRTLLGQNMRGAALQLGHLGMKLDLYANEAPAHTPSVQEQPSSAPESQ